MRLQVIDYICCLHIKIHRIERIFNCIWMSVSLHSDTLRKSMNNEYFAKGKIKVEKAR